MLEIQQKEKNFYELSIFEVGDVVQPKGSNNLFMITDSKEKDEEYEEEVIFLVCLNSGELMPFSPYDDFCEIDCILKIKED